MTRRHLLAGSFFTALAQNSVPKLTRPRALRPGATVGLITPSTYVSDPDRLALAERTLKFFDLKPKFGRNVRKRNGYLGGSIEEFPSGDEMLRLIEQNGFTTASAHPLSGGIATIYVAEKSANR